MIRPLYISTPTGNVEVIDRIFYECQLEVGDRVYPADLLVMTMHDFDVMFVTKGYPVIIQTIPCESKEVLLKIVSVPRLCSGVMLI